MLFIEALSKASAQPNSQQSLNRGKRRSIISYRDSVDLSIAGHQVKEIHIDSREKSSLTASSSIFANLIEHVLRYLSSTKLTLKSPEELNLEDKDWKLFLQIPPTSTENRKGSGGYLIPEVHRQPPAKQLIFHIPVKPSYGNKVEMTILLSAHQGSPDVPDIFHLFPKENQLPTLNTPYPPEFINQQMTHYRILLDQDGEPDQLSALYAYVHQSKVDEKSANTPLLSCLRLWQAKGNTLSPIALGDNKIGLLYIGHYHSLSRQSRSKEERDQQSNNLYMKV